MPRARISFTPILPKNKFDANIYRDEWERAMRQKVKPDLQKLFKDTVEGWESKPTFRGTINKSTSFLRLLVKAVGSNAPLYAMIDVAGADPHTIVPRKAPSLVYRPGYTAATRPRVLKSRRKRRSGPIVTAQVVRHPGFEAREFSITIAEEYQAKYVQVMNKATERATAKMGRTL